MLTPDTLVKSLTTKFKGLEPLNIPEFHKEVYVKMLKGSEVDACRNYLVGQDESIEVQSAYWMVATLCNKNREPLFPVTWESDDCEATIKEHVKLLTDLPFGVFNDVGTKIHAINGMGGDSEEVEKKD